MLLHCLPQRELVCPVHLGTRNRMRCVEQLHVRGVRCQHWRNTLRLVLLLHTLNHGSNFVQGVHTTRPHPVATTAAAGLSLA